MKFFCLMYHICTERDGDFHFYKSYLLLREDHILVSSINGLINNDSPVIPQESLIISGSLIAGGIALIPLTTRRYKTDNEKWRLKILDFTE